MHKNIFVNLPVKDLARSVEFFTKVGYSFNPQFTDDNATCMIIGENIFVMLLVEPFFTSFIPNPVSDAANVSEVIIALSCDSSGEVNELTSRAIAAGATQHKKPSDLGFMYSSMFQDLDGHFWEPFWMDPTHVQ
ncbi:MAG: VOC family protein [Ilumatobacteraceae bacterium]